MREIFKKQEDGRYGPPPETDGAVSIAGAHGVQANPVARKAAAKVPFADILDLARIVTGQGEGADLDQVEQCLDEKIGVSLEQFICVVQNLLPHVPAVSLYPGAPYARGFVHDGAFVVQQGVKD